MAGILDTGLTADNAITWANTFYSLDDFVDAAIANRRYGNSGGDSWAGGSWDDAIRQAKNGAPDLTAKAMPLVDSAISYVHKETELHTWEPVWDVTGGAVDVGAYVTGVPENMVRYDPAPVSNVGRVITLCASVCYSGALSVDTVLRRGVALTALALALEETGHAVELWADLSTSGRARSGGRMYAIRTRVLVKGAHDFVDHSRIAYAYAHPTMLRHLGFAQWDGAPEKFHTPCSLGGGYGSVTQPLRDLPDGTLYLPGLRSSADVPEPERFVIDTLRDLGLITPDPDNA